MNEHSVGSKDRIGSQDRAVSGFNMSWMAPRRPDHVDLIMYTYDRGRFTLPPLSGFGIAFGLNHNIEIRRYISNRLVHRGTCHRQPSLIAPHTEPADWEFDGPGRAAVAYLDLASMRRAAEELDFDLGEPDLPSLYQTERPEILHLCQLIADAPDQFAGSTLAHECLTNMLSLNVLRCYKADKVSRDIQGKPLSASEMEIIRQYVEDHLEIGVTVQDLARLLGTNRWRISRHFKDAFGESFPRYVKSRRIQRAADLLRGTELSLTDVAAKVGFSDQSNFTTAFREILDATPRRYRIQMRA